VVFFIYYISLINLPQVIVVNLFKELYHNYV